MSSFFEDRHSLTETEIGLPFIANRVGSMIGTLVTGNLLALDYRRVEAADKTRLSQIDDETWSGIVHSTTDTRKKSSLKK